MFNKIFELLNDVNKDSFEIGTPAKGGHFKIYCDFTKLDETKKRIDNAVEARNYAREKVMGD